jgi:hypothetical protein
VINLALLLAITPLVAFYLLRDWPKLLAEVDSWLPHEHAETIRAQARLQPSMARAVPVLGRMTMPRKVSVRHVRFIEHPLCGCVRWRLPRRPT